MIARAPAIAHPLEPVDHERIHTDPAKRRREGKSGLTTAQLQTQLQAGKTLAQIAAATSGKTTDGLVGALVAAEKTELAAAVSAGRLTQAQADTIAATLTQRFTDLVNGVRPAHGPDGHPGFFGGPPPSGPNA